MKSILTLVAIATFSVSSFAQSYLVQVKPEGSKAWGYADQTGEVVLPAEYSKCYHFSEGLAIVYRKKELVFLKPDGDFIRPEEKGFVVAKASFFGLQGFSNGLLQVSLNKKWGYINKEGAFTIKNEFDKATVFNDGVAAVKIGEEHFIINTAGEKTKVEIEGIKEIKRFTEGRAPIYMLDGKVGFIDASGNIAAEPNYISVGYFSNGLAWAKNDKKQLGYIDKDGNWAIDAKFQAGKNFDKTSGLARVKYKDKWAYVSTSGDIIYIDNTLVWGDFYDGLAKGKKDDKFGFYNSKGEYAIAPQFEGVRNFRNGFAAAKLNGLWGMINQEGEWILEPKFAGIKDMELIP